MARNPGNLSLWLQPGALEGIMIIIGEGGSPLVKGNPGQLSIWLQEGIMIIIGEGGALL